LTQGSAFWISGLRGKWGAGVFGGIHSTPLISRRKTLTYGQCLPARVLLVILLAFLDLLDGLIHEFHSFLTMATLIGRSPLKFFFGLLQVANCCTHVWFVSSHLAVLGEQAHSC
jgi:hypothetical protein